MASKGITFIELMFSVSIMAITFSIGFISFKPFLRSINLKHAAVEIANIFYMAKIRAVTDKVNYGVFFDVNTKPQTYTLFLDSGNTARLLDEKDKILINKKTLPNGVKYADIKDPVTFKDGSNDNDTALFTPLGTSNGGTIYIEGEDKDEGYYITVRSATAKITIKRD